MTLIIVFRQMTSLEDDAYSFGYILLEALVGPSKSDRREAFMQNDMVSKLISGLMQILLIYATINNHALFLTIDGY